MRHADGCSKFRVLAVKLEWPGDCLDDAPRYNFGLVSWPDQYGEFVASEPGDDAIGWDDFKQTSSDRSQ